MSGPVWLIGDGDYLSRRRRSFFIIFVDGQNSTWGVINSKLLNLNFLNVIFESRRSQHMNNFTWRTLTFTFVCIFVTNGLLWCQTASASSLKMYSFGGANFVSTQNPKPLFQVHSLCTYACASESVKSNNSNYLKSRLWCTFLVIFSKSPSIYHWIRLSRRFFSRRRI